MLAALPQNRVISEAYPIDWVLRTHLHHPEVTDAMRTVWLKGMISALGQPQSADEKHFFVKLDSWHTLDLELTRRAYTDVPWLFVYRDPGEVMVSHGKQRGVHMVPDMLEPPLFGLDATEIFQMPAEEYGARVLGKIGEAVLEKHHWEGYAD